MKLALLSTLVFLLLSNFASAAEGKDSEVLQLLTQELQKNDYTTARQHISSNSQTLFDRYSKYSLGALMPAKITTLKESASESHRYLKVSGSNQFNANARAMTVAFVTEDNNPKIDIPETLRLGFGPNWPEKINTMEQTYNFSRQNFGEAQSLQMLNAMLGK